ncbi:MAG: biotin--acetyl-CoA-carboxylase ligase [Acidimicrobiia bacterium]|nr:biotin--acetyl-CoA-carboxylase ligase [Acidimicrobiia bacterium]
MPPPTPKPAHWRVKRVASTGSTNSDVLALAAAGEPDGLVLVADHQTAGRGRLGRTWEAPPGSSFLASVLVRPALDVADLHLLTQWVALAAVDACQAAAGVTAELKWPNDLMVGDRKLAGVLAESTVVQARATAVAVGVGLNVSWAYPDTGVSLRELSDHTVTTDDVLEAFLEALGEGPDPAVIRAAYRQRLSTVGQHVRVELPGDHFEGIATDVGDDGRLVVAVGGETRLLAAGDVIHLRRVDS